jgi:hypothetical protein
MADQDYFEKDWKDAELYWSVIKYTRAWWATDGARFDVMGTEKKLNVHLIRSIATEYNVVRSLPGSYKASNGKDKIEFTEESDQVASKIVSVLDDSLVNWRGDLSAKAEICIEICKALRVKLPGPYNVAPFYNNALSATSKFVWFLQPKEWTMYDSYACSGLFGKKLPTNEKTFQDFYCTLQKLNFTDHETQVQAAIDKTFLRGLPASRVLDTLLMGRAQGDPKDAGESMVRRMTYMRGFLGNLPFTVSDQLRTSATQIHDAVYEENMLRIDTGVKP